VKVHLVDGTYELFRAFYGAPPAEDAWGRPVGAVRGILATLSSLLRERDVSHVACAFDHVIESFRNRLFAGYKTGEGVEADLLAQFEPRDGGGPVPGDARGGAGRDLLSRQGSGTVRRRAKGDLPGPPPPPRP
jgi:hypothetical protein